MWAIKNFNVLDLSKTYILFPLCLMMMSVFGQCISFSGGVTDECRIGKDLCLCLWPSVDSILVLCWRANFKPQTSLSG